MTTVAQVMIEVGRLHMENIELRSQNEVLAEKVRELEGRLETKKVADDIQSERPTQPETAVA